MSGHPGYAGGVGPADEHAAYAERAVLDRHLRRVWALPGTALGVSTWPAGGSHRSFLCWDYWWQAHLLDALVDAQLRAPSEPRRTTIAALVRGHRVRNLGRWTNDYHDDMAWLGLALLRAAGVGVVRRRAVAVLARTLRDAADDSPGVALPWRRGDTVRNVPANGTAGLLLARLGDVVRAEAVADWIDSELLDAGSGLVLDGVRDGQPPDRAVYTYCQGIVLGLETELAVRTGGPRHAARVARLVAAVAEHLSPGGVLQGCGTGDGGLFAGITARYLAVVAVHLPGRDAPARQARELARQLVRASAQAAWAHRASEPAQGRFGVEWSLPATQAPADLSVQLSAGTLLEADADLCRRR